MSEPVVPAREGGMSDVYAALAQIDAARLTALAAALIAAGGENPGGDEAGTVEVLAAALRGLGARVELDEVAPGRPNLLARFGPEPFDGGLLFLGHSDVVPAGAGWSFPPFEPTLADGELIGRGATDMKGGLAAVAEAMAALHRARPELPIGLLCTVDEEVDASGALRYLGTADPVPLGACIVAEPTDLVTIIGCRGATNLRIDIRGASAHAGRPSDGASAILAAADLIGVIGADVERCRAEPHPTLGAATWNVGTISGGHGTSIVPDRCTLGVDRRLLPGEQPEEILADLLATARRRIEEREPRADDVVLDAEIEMVMPGFFTPADTELVEVATAALAEIGRSPSTDIWTASCEGGFVAAHHAVPTIVLGPGDITTQAHQPDERVAIADLVDAARAYTLIGMRLPLPTPSATTPTLGSHAPRTDHSQS